MPRRGSRVRISSSAFTYVGILSVCLIIPLSSTDIFLFTIVSVSRDFFRFFFNFTDNSFFFERSTLTLSQSFRVACVLLSMPRILASLFLNTPSEKMLPTLVSSDLWLSTVVLKKLVFALLIKPLCQYCDHFGLSSTSNRVSLSPLTQTYSALQSGTLLRGQPYLSELAWERGCRHLHTDYSLVGVIHTLAPP